MWRSGCRSPSRWPYGCCASSRRCWLPSSSSIARLNSTNRGDPMIRLRPAFWPTLVSLPILVLSLGLGIWQMERREWKRDILDRIATNQAAPPMTLDQLLSGVPLRHEYGRVKVVGTF
ncbi:MAG: hypothetical protein EPO10_22130, partial [Reyranella sp.]